MDFQNQGQNQTEYRPNGMATAAYITAILSCISIFILPVYLPCILGSISIVLALLSRGSQHTLSRRGRISVIAAAGSLLLNGVILALCFYLVFCVPEFRTQFNQAYEQLYGESFDDTLDDILDN